MNDDIRLTTGVDQRREHGMLQRLRFEAMTLGSTVDRLLVGFSGGSDSLALLALVSELSRLDEFDVVAVHVDHGVRSESSSDVDRVIAAANALNVPLLVKVVSPERLSSHKGAGLEESLRRERYRLFADALDESGSEVLVLAHHQQDQAETVLMHLLRGSGLRGASGMRSFSSLNLPWLEESDRPSRLIDIWRPLLGEPVRAVRDLAFSLDLPIVEDASNQDDAFRRNALRHRVLPIVEEMAPGSVANLARFATIAAEDDDELDRQAHATFDLISHAHVVRVGEVLALPLAIRRRVVRLLIETAAPRALEVPLHRIEAVLRVLESGAGGREVEIGLGVSVLIAGGSLHVRASSDSTNDDTLA